MEDEIVVNLQKNETIDIDERLEEVRKQNE
jgi:hypothetical protein